jgi:hypothetical protein
VLFLAGPLVAVGALAILSVGFGLVAVPVFKQRLRPGGRRRRMTDRAEAAVSCGGAAECRGLMGCDTCSAQKE